MGTRSESFLERAFWWALGVIVCIGGWLGTTIASHLGNLSTSVGELNKNMAVVVTEIRRVDAERNLDREKNERLEERIRSLEQRN